MPGAGSGNGSAPTHGSEQPVITPADNPFAIPGTACAATGGMPILRPRGGLAAPLAPSVTSPGSALPQQNQPQANISTAGIAGRTPSSYKSRPMSRPRSRSTRSSSIGASSNASRMRKNDDSKLDGSERSAVGTPMYRFRHNWANMNVLLCGIILSSSLRLTSTFRAFGNDAIELLRQMRPREDQNFRPSRYEGVLGA